MPAKKRKEPSATTGNTVAYLGQQGSFTEQAATDFFSHQAGKDYTFESRSNLDAVFQAVANGEVAHGVVPFENSETGTFRQVQELLIKHSLFITGECAVQEDLCLVALKGVKREDIREVYSHPAVFDSCKGYLRKLSEETKSDLQLIVSNDTAGSCRLLKERNLKTAAAIASARAAKLQSVEVLEHKVSDDSSIATRYIVLGTKMATPPSHKTLRASLALSLSNEPGSMFRLLSCFQFREINIMKVETRPSASVASTGAHMFQRFRHWEYVFYVDYEPSRKESVNAALIANLKEYCMTVRELGVYEQNLPVLEWHGPAWLTSDLSAI